MFGRPAYPSLLKKTVFFDFGGTLLVLRRDRIISRILSDAGHPASAELVHSAYSSAEPRWLPRFADRTLTGQETEEAYRQLEAETFRILFPEEAEEEVERMSTLMRRQWNAVGASVPLELYPDVLPTLEKLRSDGYTMGLVSNAPSETMRTIQKLGLQAYLQVIVVSGAVGVAKPDPEIFHIALRRAGSKPEESIHVGDLYEADVVGARNAGLEGILIDRSGNHPGLDCPTISDLGGVYGLLE